MKGKLIVIEGTDCSGKETQTKLLVERLEKENIKCVRFSFPNYDSPTGKIVGGPYLGKDYICEGWFEEGAINVDPMVASLYYAADRKYNMPKINELLENGVNVILDRYTYSNLAHQGAKLDNERDRLGIYRTLSKLEFGILELPEADIKVFLHMPYDVASELKKNREEKPDQHEASKEHLLMAELAYKEIAHLYEFKTIECSYDNKPRKIEDINDELYDIVKKKLNNEVIKVVVKKKIR